MMRLVALATLLFSALGATAAPTLTVDCDAGQSLNRTLAKMDKFTPATVTVKGTCTEYVLIDGFNGLTLNAVQGATLQQPNTNPQSNPYVLSIKASRGVTVLGLAVHSSSSLFSSIGIGGGSNDVRLQSVTTDGSWGVVVYEASQVWLVRVTDNLTVGYAAVSAYDKSDVHIVDGLLQRPANSAFNAGLLVGSGHVTMQGMTIRDMQQSININSSGSVDLVNFDSTGGTDVVIDNPGGTNYNGSLVFDGSTLNAGANLVVSGSQGQGVIVSNDSHAELAGSSITGGAHGGLVVVNLSTAGVDTSNPLTVISANGTDLFCDSRSQIAGALNIANATVVQCNNLLPGNYENLP